MVCLLHIHTFRSGHGNLMTVNGRKIHYDYGKIRGYQYRLRISEIKMPIDLYNGTEWDLLSQKIWAKFEQRRQSRELFEKKMLLWNNLSTVVKVCTVLYIHKAVELKRKMKI